MIEQQIYAGNTQRAYPLAEGSVTSIPHDIVVDMSLTVPEGIYPVITAIRVTPFIAFVAVEDPVSRTALGQVTVPRPVPFRVYRFDMPMSGAFGWIVFGPGCTREQNYPMISAEIDEQTIIRAPYVTGALQEITVNGNTYDFTGIAGFLSLNNLIDVSVETRTVETVPEDVVCLVLKRNDSSFDYDTLYGGLVVPEEGIGNPVKSISGAVPNAAGIINIVSEGNSGEELTLSAISSGGGYIGMVVDRAETCPTWKDRRTVKHGRCQQGIKTADGLPCDPLVEAIYPQYAEEDCGCSEGD